MYMRSRDTRYRLTGIPSHSAPGAAERACERVGLFLALTALRGWAPTNAKGVTCPTRARRRDVRHKYCKP